MKNTTHRVVILKNINSDMISQAILFLKDSAYENDTSLILEAERVVEKYMNKKMPVENLKSNSRLKAGFLSAGIVLLCIGVFVILRIV